MINESSKKIKIEGYRGTWSVLQSQQTLYLLEHEWHGDETPCLIVDSKLNVIMDDVHNGFDDLEWIEVDEYCAECETELQFHFVKSISPVQKCSNCGEQIVLCSMCNNNCKGCENGSNFNPIIDEDYEEIGDYEEMLWCDQHLFGGLDD